MCRLGATKGITEKQSQSHQTNHPQGHSTSTFGWCADECTYYLIQFELGFLLLSTQSRQTAKLSQATLREISRCLLVDST